MWFWEFQRTSSIDKSLFRASHTLVKLLICWCCKISIIVYRTSYSIRIEPRLFSLFSVYVYFGQWIRISTLLFQECYSVYAVARVYNKRIWLKTDPIIREITQSSMVILLCLLYENSGGREAWGGTVWFNNCFDIFHKSPPEGASSRCKL